MLIPYSVAICSMWSLSSLYCSGKENRIIPEEMAFRNGLAQSVHRSETKLLALSPVHFVSPGTHTWKWAFVPRNMAFTGMLSCAECGSEQPKEGVLSSDGCLERGEALRPPNGCRGSYAYSLSSWLGTSDWFIRT